MSDMLTKLRTKKEIDDFCSPYGNEYVVLDKNDIAALLKGETLGVDVNGGEYAVFISIEEDLNSEWMKNGKN